MPQKKCSRGDIAFDARMFHHSGIGTYIRGLLSGFEGHPFFENHPLGIGLPPSATWNGKSGVRRFNFYSPIYSLQEQMEYPFHLQENRLWHAPHYNAPFFNGKSRLVVTIHDLIHWIFRGRFFSKAQASYTRLLLQRIVKTAGKIIAVSNRTREDLISYFGAPPEKVRVIYEGVDPAYFNPPPTGERKKVLDKYGLPENFFLYVGLIKPHKNVGRLVSIYKSMRQRRTIEASLVIVGKKDKKYPAGYEELAGIKTGEGIYYLTGVDSQSDLGALYASVMALVHPSLYEGFGLTVLEAMASGAPVIVSRAASLPEVVGEAGYFVDPLSDDSVVQALSEMERKEALRKSLSEKGKKRAAQFGWKAAADETVKVYQEVLRG